MEIFLGILIIAVAIAIMLNYFRSLTFPIIAGILAILANIVIAILSYVYGLPLWVTIVAGIAVILDVVSLIAVRAEVWWSFFSLIPCIGAWSAVAAGCFMAA